MYPITIQMAPQARMIVEEVLAIKPGEQVLILTDAERPTTITQALASAVAAVAGETIVMTMKARASGGVEPPSAVAAAIRTADVVIFQNSYAVFHTNASREARAGGARTCELWGLTEETMLRGGLTADYEEVERTSRRLAGIMGKARYAHLTTADGTDLTMTIEGRKPVVLYGRARERGQSTGLPEGEAVISPVEGSAEGVLVNPVTVEKREIAFPKEPMRIEVREGMIRSVTGGSEAGFLARLLEEAGPSARNIAEFALGTNPECQFGSNLREAKKVLGSAHIGIGDNKSLGGHVDSPLHIDLIFRNPTVTVDDTLLVKDGKLIA